MKSNWKFIQFYLFRIQWSWGFVESVGRILEIAVVFPGLFPAQARSYILVEVDRRRIKCFDPIIRVRRGHDFCEHKVRFCQNHRVRFCPWCGHEWSFRLHLSEWNRHLLSPFGKLAPKYGLHIERHAACQTKEAA